MQTFFSRVGTTLTIIIGGIALFILGSFLPIEGNYEFRIVQSGSMEPAIKTGSVIAIIPRDTYSEGDVITFSGTSINSMPTTHRIVSVEETTDGSVFITKGDANKDVDYLKVKESEVIGKVFLAVPYAGHIARFLGTPNGTATLVALGIVLFSLSFVPWKAILEKKKVEIKDENS